MGFALPSGVVNTDSAYFIADNTLQPFGPLVKQPSDQTLIVIDYSIILPLTSFNFAVDVSTNPQLVISYPSFENSGTMLTFLVSGGIVGQQYSVTISVGYTTGPYAHVDTLIINIPSYDDCGCHVINPIPQLYNQLPLNTQGYVNTGVRYFWGSIAPANPNVMDQWFNTSTQTLFEWASDGTNYSWEALQGLEGPQGPQGLQGPTGSQGIQGLQGLQGAQGVQGIPGQTGPQGVPGQNAIIVGQFGASKTPANLPPNGIIPANWDAAGSPPAQLTMQSGQALFYTVNSHVWTYVGTSMTAAGWVDLGANQGPQGPQGPAGTPGAQGMQGIPGSTGAQGIQGIQGIQGNPGQIGPMGPPGPTTISTDLGNMASLGSDNLIYVSGNLDCGTF